MAEGAVARARRAATLTLLVVGSMAVTSACGRGYDGAGDLRAERVVLEREVEGLRAIVGRLERGEPLLPPNDVAIGVDEELVRDLIAAQLPFAADIDRFHAQLTSADVQFRGSATVQLRGRLHVRDQPDLAADLTLFGALADVRVDQASSTLLATVAVDHLTIAENTGIARYLSGSTIDEVARLARLQIGTLLPTIRIPVKVQQSVAFPELTDGPVRLAGATMPLEAAVSQVVAARGRLWVSVKVTPGAFAALEPAPEAVAR